MKSGAILVTGPGVLTSGGSVGSGCALGGDAVAVSSVVSATDVEAGDSEPQASTIENIATKKIAMNDRLICRRSELIRFTRSSTYTFE